MVPSEAMGRWPFAWLKIVRDIVGKATIEDRKVCLKKIVRQPAMHHDFMATAYGLGFRIPFHVQNRLSAYLCGAMTPRTIPKGVRGETRKNLCLGGLLYHCYAKCRGVVASN